LGYTAISSHLPAALREIGVSDEQLQRIMIDNPRRALTGAD
jgi:predicted metal-dependent phosphotriesterase family hydrolase